MLGGSAASAAAYESGARKLTAAKELTPLEASVLAQDSGCMHGMLACYSKALAEIKAGRKDSHWIWYIWPAHTGVRPSSSQPQFSLTHASQALEWLHHPILGPRYLEVTSAAVEHLEKGVAAGVLFGSGVDVTKFHECVTMFAVAAETAGRQAAECGGSGGKSSAKETLEAQEAMAVLCRRALAALKMGEHPNAAKVARAELAQGRCDPALVIAGQ